MAFLFLAQATVAQPYTVNVTIIVPPPYSPYLQDYLQYENKMVVQLQNLTSQQQSVKLVGSVEGDNGIALITDENYQPATPINIPPNGIYRIPGSTRSRGFLDPDNLEFIGPENLKTKILKDGILPEGTYTICIRAVDYTTGEPLSDEAPAGCTIIPLSFPTPPQPVLPECESDIETRLPSFQWTLPGGNTGQAALQYDLYIVEWLEGANPQDLVQLAVDYNAGNAIVRRNLLVPMYQYLITDPRLKENTPYLWVVKVRDRMGKVLFENNGQSEICMFNYSGEEESGTDLTTAIFKPGDLQIVQTRTQISGKLKYKFPGNEPIAVNNLVRRNMQIETEEEPYAYNAGSPHGDLGIFDNNVYAMADHNYIDAFPVPLEGSNPLKNIEVKLVESWAIVDCNVTYLPSNYTEHRDFFILPNDYFRPPAPGAGVSITVYIQGLAEPGIIGPLAMGMSGSMTAAYSRTLDVDRTDASGNFKFNFTQSAPGYTLLQYPGAATVTMTCNGREEEQEQDPFDHPLDMQSNPTDIYYDNWASPIDVIGNPVSLPGLPQQENMVQRMAYINSSGNQQAYQSIEISGGKLYKILRLEVNSEFYYSPDLIFWTQPGDTITLPDQVSYVKSLNLDMFVKSGVWYDYPGYQKIAEGLPVSGIDIVVSREKDGLPAAIPIEEGQGLRDYAGEEPGHWQESGDYAQQLGSYGYSDPSLYDSVSILQSQGNGMVHFRKLVATHDYFIKGNPPNYNTTNYEVPLQQKLYNVFNTLECKMNLGTGFNSFCQHQPITISDTITAIPLTPRVFGRTTEGTSDEIQPLADVLVRLKRYENGNYKPPMLQTYSDQNGEFRFENLPVDPDGTETYYWRIEFSKPGYEPYSLPFNQQTPGTDYMPLPPGSQWALPNVQLIPKGQLVGYIKDEAGKLIQAIVRLADGPYIQTTLVNRPYASTEFCGDVNNMGDAINESTQLTQLENMNNLEAEIAEQHAARFSLPAQSGNQMQLIIIPLPEQYFQDTCLVDVEDVAFGESQFLGYITVKEKLHRINITVKGPDGNAAQARVYINDHVRETNQLGFTAFRFPSTAEEFRVRIVPELASMVPVDTIMTFPVSKEYISHVFTLREGRKIKVKVITEFDGPHQPANPIPIQGAVVQTILTQSSSGNSYIQCITGSDGVCTLEGVPTGPATVDISAWKESDDHLYIGKTVTVSTNRPLNPPVEIKLKVLSGVSVKDIWGFPAVITDLEIRTNNNGTRDTLMKGALTELPENSRFRTADNEVQVPFVKSKFTFSGQREDDGRKIYWPVTPSLMLTQPKVNAMLFDAFAVTVSPKRVPNGNSNYTLFLEKTQPANGKIEGVVETELASFNFSYSYDGKFYLGKTPTEYNLNIFQSGHSVYNVYVPSQILEINQDPEPGPDDFYLLDIGPQNRPRSHQYTVFGFPASSDSSRSFVTNGAFYIHTILHTDIDDVDPGDMKLNVGKIVVMTDDLQTLDNGYRMLDFKMGRYWRYYSTTPYRYDHALGGITASEGYISTGQIDVPVTDVIIKYDDLYMSNINSISHLTLAGIKDIYMEPDVNIVLMHDEQENGWELIVQKSDEHGPIHDAVIAVMDSLPLFKRQDRIYIHEVIMHSQRNNFDLHVTGTGRPYDICDFSVLAISTGQDYFEFFGSVELGREDVRVPGLPPSFMTIQFNGPKSNLTGKIMSEYAGELRTRGDVGFVFDYSTGGVKRQHFSQQRYSTTGWLTVYDKDDENSFQLKAILDVDYNHVKLHIIHDALNIPFIQYAREDQSIDLGITGRKLLVQRGLQQTEDNGWEFLSFDANMVGFQGVKANQPPMTFDVTGPVEVDDGTVEVDGLDFGFAEIRLTYNFETTTLVGFMDFNVSPGEVFLGPVSVSHIQASVLIDPTGFLFYAAVQGKVIQLFDAQVGVLLGSHDAIPPHFVDSTLQFAFDQSIPEVLADYKIGGFFITAGVDLFNESIGDGATDIFGFSASARAGIDARIFMDFNQNGGAFFGFSALAFFEAKAEATLLLPCEPPNIFSVLCVAARAEIEITGTAQESGGHWNVTFGGCGSLVFSASMCGWSDSIGAWVSIEFSTDDGITPDGGFGSGGCSGNPNQPSCENLNW